MPNRFSPIQPNTPDDQRIAIINKNFAELDAEGVNKVYRGPDGLPRIWIDGRTGIIKVAPEGVDVTTAADSQLDFNSSQRVFKIVGSGTLAGPALSVSNPGAGNFASTSATSSDDHDLEFVPAVLAYFDQAGVHTPLPFTSVGGASGTSARWWNNFMTMTETSVVFNTEVTVTNQSFSLEAGAVTVKYYLLQETAN